MTRRELLSGIAWGVVLGFAFVGVLVALPWLVAGPR